MTARMAATFMEIGMWLPEGRGLPEKQTQRFWSHCKRIQWTAVHVCARIHMNGGVEQLCTADTRCCACDGGPILCCSPL